ncbi:MAG: hypothetical protein R3E84_04850 [Pseudomonadales bacterium]
MGLAARTIDAFGNAVNEAVRWFDRHTAAVDHRLGHPPGVLLLGFLAAMVALLGPSVLDLSALVPTAPALVSRVPTPAWWLVAFGAVTWNLLPYVVSRRFPRWWRGYRLFVFQSVPLGFAIVVLLVKEPYATEASMAPFPNVMGCLLLLSIAAIWIAYAIRRRKVRRLLLEDGRFLSYWQNVSLLPLDVDVGNPPVLSWRRYWVAAATPVYTHVVRLLVFTCGLYIMVRTFGVDSKLPLFLALAALVYGFMFIGGLREHWDLAIVIARRYFLLGWPALVSAVVVALALMDLFNVSYVTTLLEGGPVKSVVTASYVAAWYHEYWINNWFYAQLIDAIARAAGDGATSGAPRLGFSKHQAGKRIAINLQASNRFLVSVSEGGRVRFRLFTLRSLIDYLDRNDPLDVAGAHRQLVWLQQQFHFVACNITHALLFFACLFMTWLGGAFQADYALTVQAPSEAPAITPGSAVATARGGQQQRFDFHARVRDAHDRGGRPVLVALSGGGTRAAMNGAAFLCGMRGQERLRDVVVLSGVSGGSAAAAYFAMHRPALLAENCSPEALLGEGSEGGASVWARFFSAMAADYISEVLRGTAEVRIAGPVGNGVLLAESFHRYFVDGAPDERRTLADVDDIGLIFNTSVAGHAPLDSRVLAGLREHAALAADYDFSDAGGRLVFTNVPEHGAGKGGAAPQCGGNLVMASIDDTHAMSAFAGAATPLSAVPLAYAAAASASFPPVFSAFGVRIGNAPPGGGRYWVTDGGVIDNRGVMSLLERMLPYIRDMANADSVIDLVVVDSSAMLLDYQPNRGVGAVLGAASVVADQVIASQLRCGGRHLRQHVLAMPLALRSRGGIGTHWKAPSSITVHNPWLPQPPILDVRDSASGQPNLSGSDGSPCLRKERITLKAQEYKRLIAGLFFPDATTWAGEDRTCVTQWLRADHALVPAWQAFLGVAPAAPGS